MKQQTVTFQVNMMCMCMMCCWPQMSDPGLTDFGNAEAVNLRARCLP